MNILRRKGDGQPRRTPFSLNTPLLRLSSNTSDYWTIGDSFEHTLIFGGTGSGKTSTSAAALATAFLKAGYGGCILCAKSDEAARWEAYARIAGRPTSTIRFDASGRYRFNFLDYLMHRPGDGGGIVDNTVSTLMHVLAAAHGRDGMATDGENDFWNKAIKDLLSNAIGSLFHAYGRVRLR